MKTRDRCLVVATVVACGMLPATVTAQSLSIEPGDWVRVEQRLEQSFGNWLLGRKSRTEAVGIVQALRGDTLYLSDSDGNPSASFPLDELDSFPYSLLVHAGSNAGRWAFRGGVQGAFVGFYFGYCFSALSDNCSGDLGGGLTSAAVLGAAGALLGGLIGSTSRRYEEVGLDALGRSSGIRVTPFIGTEGMVGLSASFSPGAR